MPNWRRIYRNKPELFDFSEMSTVLLGMLGLGAMRTTEKIKGVA